MKKLTDPHSFLRAAVAVLLCSSFSYAGAQIPFPSTGVIASGAYHNLSVSSNGLIWAWGANSSGQTGNGGTSTVITFPIQPNDLTEVVAVAGGNGHSLALTTDGSVYGWGKNANGQLGNGTASQSNSPSLIPGLPKIISIAAGDSHSLAIASDGTVWAWGKNSNGQVGDNTTTQRLTPVKVSGLTGVVAIAAGAFHSLAVKSDGSVWAWGLNSNGQLGDNTTIQRVVPVQVTGLTAVKAVAAGAAHSLALRTDSTLRSWGLNGSGQLGDGTTSQRSIPVMVSNQSGILAIACGSNHSLAVAADHSVRCWGANAGGQLGDGTKVNRTLAVQIPSSTDAVSVSAGASHSLVLRSDGTIDGFGSNNDGEFGNGSQTGMVLQPTPLPSVVAVASIAAGGSHTITIKSDGTAWAWGSNSNGQLGNNTTISSDTPVQVSGLTGALKAAAGIAHSLVVKSDGSVWSWGKNGNGQLGDGTTTQRVIPIKITSLTAVSAVSAGAAHSIALKSDGTVWAWGLNSNGQLGDGTTAQRTVPVKVAGLIGIVAVAAGDVFNLALKNDGTVWSWGLNSSGQLGDGTTTQRLTPIKIAGASAATAIATGSSHSIFLKSDGTIYTWGSNNNAQLGDGSYVPHSTPVVVAGIGNVKAIAAGNGFTLAVDNSGQLWAWGINSSAQLGNGTLATVTTPTVAAQIGNAANLAAGAGHGAVRKTDGTIITWGTNNSGQLGFPRPNNGKSSLKIIASLPTVDPSRTMFLAIETTNVASNIRPRQFNNYGVFTNVSISNSGVVNPAPISAFSINDNGTVVGYYDLPPSYSHTPAIYKGGILTSLNSTDSSIAVGINDSETTIIGAGDFGYYGWKRTGSNMTPLPVLTGLINTDITYPNSLNNLGDVVGVTGMTSDYQEAAALWPAAGGVIDLRPMVGTDSHANDINNNQQIVGVSFDHVGDGEPFLLDFPTKKETLLAKLPLGVYPQVFSGAFAINQDGIAVGASAGRAVLWKEGKCYDLIDSIVNTMPQLPPNIYTCAWCINNSNQIILSYNTMNAYWPVSGFTGDWWKTFILTPLPQLAVDANRDGIINLTDGTDQTSTQVPYRFWLNNDNDTQTTPVSSGTFPDIITTDELIDGETTPVKTADCSKHTIGSKRNLEDFARLWIPFGGLQQALASGKLQLGLKWKDGYTGTPAINIYPSADSTGSDSYLKDENAAWSQTVGIFNSAVGDKKNNQTVDTSGIFIFKPDYWSPSETNKKCFLFEGASEGKGQLVVEIFDASGLLLGEGPGLWLELKDIKKMYPQYQATPATLDKPFTVEVPFDPETAGYRLMPGRPLFEPAADEEKMVFVMVNGSNEEYSYATSVAETVFKRLYWQGYKGRLVSFRWETLQGPFDGGLPAQYNLNEWLAWSWGKSLKDFMASSELPSSYVKNIGTHSLGCTLVGAALKRGMLASNVILMQGAIPAGCFDTSGGRDDPTSVNGYDKMWEKELYNFTPDFASEFGYRGYVTNSGGATIYSFYNVNDYALFSGPLQVWEGNQELYKPDSLPGFNNQYTYSRDGTLLLSQRGQVISKITGDVLRYVALPYESMAFVARSRSKALGARAGVSGIISATYNIGAGSETNLGDQRRDHSGEFERHIQQLQAFYQRLADIIK